MREKREQRRGGAVAAPGRRVERVAGQVQRILSELLVGRASDPRLEGVLVTGVQMTADLRLARVHVHRFGIGPVDRKGIEAGLAAATPFFRRELAAGLDLRFTPELRFYWDEKLDEARRIDALLHDARPRARADRGAEAGPEATDAGRDARDAAEDAGEE